MLLGTSYVRNRAASGAVLCTFNSPWTVGEAAFSQNSASGGGGVYFADQDMPTLDAATLTYGGASMYSSPLIEPCQSRQLESGRLWLQCSDSNVAEPLASIAHARRDRTDQRVSHLASLRSRAPGCVRPARRLGQLDSGDSVGGQHRVESPRIDWAYVGHVCQRRCTIWRQCRSGHGAGRPFRFGSAVRLLYDMLSSGGPFTILFNATSMLHDGSTVQLGVSFGVTLRACQPGEQFNAAAQVWYGRSLPSSATSVLQPAVHFRTLQRRRERNWLQRVVRDSHWLRDLTIGRGFCAVPWASTLRLP